jgi:hypothetical protein
VVTGNFQQFRADQRATPANLAATAAASTGAPATKMAAARLAKLLPPPAAERYDRRHPRHPRAETRSVALALAFVAGWRCGARRLLYAGWLWNRRRALAAALLPYEIALARLEEARALMQPENAREFSIAVSEIVRQYIEAAFPGLGRAPDNRGVSSRPARTIRCVADEPSQLCWRSFSATATSRSSPAGFSRARRWNTMLESACRFVRETGQVDRKYPKLSGADGRDSLFARNGQCPARCAGFFVDGAGLASTCRGLAA